MLPFRVGNLIFWGWGRAGSPLDTFAEEKIVHVAGAGVRKLWSWEKNTRAENFTWPSSLTSLAGEASGSGG